MSLARLWLVLAIGLPVLAAVLAPMSSVDLTYQLRSGGEIIDARAVSSVDTWTFTAAGVPWVDQQWAAQIVLAAIYRIGGWTGLVLLRALLTSVVVGSTLAIARRRGLDPRLAAIVTVLAFIVASPAMALRPQLFGMACFTIGLLLIAMRHERPRVIWLFPALVVIWSNVHGSFVLAPVMLGLVWLEDVHDEAPAARSTIAVAIISVIAACITPFGPSVWAYAIGLSSNPSVTARTAEWQPTSLREISGALFFASAAAVAVLLARQGRRVAWPTLAWLGIFAAIGILAQRGVAWWPFVAVVGLSPFLATASRPIAAGSSRVNGLVVACVVAAAIALLPLWRPIDPRTGVPIAVLTDAPPGITDALRTLAQPGDRILNPQRWGSWLEFALPAAKVAVDSRIEMFPSKVWDAYESVLVGQEGWRDVFAGWGVDIVVVDEADQRLRERLSQLGWTTRYEDDEGSVLTPAGS